MSSDEYPATADSSRPRYLRFDASPANFPPAAIPVLPVLRPRALRWQSAAPMKARNVTWFGRARYALHEAYRRSGVGPGGTLLVPGYHCRTMFDGALSLSAPVVFYRLHPDLTPDLRDIERQLDQVRVPARALLVVHYFGRTVQLGSLATLCRHRNINLIEDCSHSMVPPRGPDGGSLMGQSGDFAVASPYKFFPSEDGGLLWTNPDSDGGVATKGPGWRDQLRAVVRVMQRARLFSEPTTPPISALTPSTPNGRDVIDEGIGPSEHYDTTLEGMAGCLASRWLGNHVDLERTARQRLRRYRQWAGAVASLPNCEPLWPDWADADTPYMFPLRLSNPGVHFPALKRLRIPVGRWDDVALSGCSVGVGSRLNLIHLPCHQSISDNQMAWMLSAVESALRSGASANAPGRGG